MHTLNYNYMTAEFEKNQSIIYPLLCVHNVKGLGICFKEYQDEHVCYTVHFFNSGKTCHYDSLEKFENYNQILPSGTKIILTQP